MVVACILVCCEAGKYKNIVSEVKKIKNVKRVFGVHGRWDVIIEVEAPDLKALSEISLKLHGLEGVRATETLISF